MVTVTIKTQNNLINKVYKQKILLSKILEDASLIVDKPCGGKGTCGKCKIKVTGDISPITKTEVEKLTSDEIEQNIRLACLTYALGDVTIYYTTKVDEMQGLIDGIMPKIMIQPLSGDKACYGLAVDIGTTTIASYLYEFPHGNCVGTNCVENTQREFGADVISRIEYSNNGGLNKLQTAVISQIEAIVSSYNVHIDTYVLTGNTTMLHLLCAIDPQSIAVSPFTPKSLFGEWKENVYFPRCISAYVGADITSAILACQMDENTTSFLVDIGTNGEMALCHNGEIVCCSTAAGPAFEGAGIKNGTLAIDGAINKVFIENDKVCYTTINNKKPVGICGTGLIDAISVMVQLNVIDETGYLEEDYKIGDSEICITSEDIRQVQLAKSAIRAGIDTLLSHCDVTYEMVEKFYIAGGFGSFINKESCGIIGLIPKEVLSKVVVVGNGAGIGASMILNSRKCLEQSEIIAKNAKVVELSASSVFMDKYVDSMMF